MVRRSALLLSLLCCALLAAGCGARSAAPPAEIAAPHRAAGTPEDSTFAHLVAQLSERGGYFDTDNLISNERSYLHALDALRARGVAGGVYLGVGPDQNFAYIAQVRPRLAFILDIRRDNLLQHVFFKTLFTLAPSRIEYLALLFGRPPPQDAAAWATRSLDDLAAYVDATLPEAASARAAVQRAAPQQGLALSEADLATIDRIHRRFIEAGLGLRFNSHGRAPNSYYPTYRDLLFETDRAGQRGHYLARETTYQFLRQMQQENRIVPVVGDLAGPHALAAVGAYLKAQGETVSVFYTSNVEDYLMRRGTFGRYVETLRALPWNAESVIVRSYFNRWRADHPETVAGYASTQLVQPIATLLAAYDDGALHSYWDLVHAGEAVPE